ncbi:MAG: hypothetical protein KJ737_14870 [Proteobacteria bacterium]|nr:hypothetical protein [Pseudomonadota bacterium]
MNARNFLTILLFFVAVGHSAFAGTGHEDKDATYKRVDMNIDVNKEDKEVGLKRMELLDKMLSRDLMDRKRSLVRSIEDDYNKKIISLLNSLIPSVFDNKVLTHVDVNFFAPDFESQIKSSQKASVSIILKREGFDIWASQNPSEKEALGTIKQLIGTTFKIPDENITILIVN